MCSHRNVTLCRGEDTFLFSRQQHFLLPNSVIKVLPSSVFLLVYLDSRSLLNQVYFSIVVFFKMGSQNFHQIRSLKMSKLQGLITNLAPITKRI